MDETLAALWCVAQALLGWFAADLLSGVAHAIIDNAFPLRDWPVIGPLHRRFQLHHDDPAELLRAPWWQIALEPVPAVLPFLPLAWLWPWFGVPLAAGGLLSTRFHVWSHRPDNPWWVAALQRARLVLPPGDHALHHQGFARRYAVVCGWSNPLLDALAALAERAFKRP